MPFGAGAYGCIGRSLGLMEIRAVVAQLLMDFDVAFAPGEDGRRMETETRDYVVMQCGSMQLSFKSRRAC